MSYFKFEIIHQSKKSRARVGRISTPHGTIDTPGFVPVGTHGTLKAIDNALTSQIGVQLMFCNTYHLILQPGSEVVKEAGGLHNFIGRTGPIITDSGGFQVFSLAYGSVASELKSKGLKKHDGSVLRISEEGVTFRSYRDGRKILLTPESSVQAQKNLGADIIIPLDELPPYHLDDKSLRSSLERTHRWEKRSLEEHLKNPNQQAMYAVVHGGIQPELRAYSAKVLSRMPFDGFAIGGSLGKNRQELVDVVSFTTPLLPPEKPNHLLGIGDLESLELCIPHGIDTFDSSYPTRAARHGVVFTFQGSINIDRSEYARDFGPLEEGCTCSTCSTVSRAYVRHLFKAHEISGLVFASVHNVHFMMRLMRRYRQLILEDRV